MSQLESQVQPVLRSLLHAPNRSLASVTRMERDVLSRWAIKTAYMLDLGGLEPRVPKEQIASLYDNAPYLPHNVYVFARLQQRTRQWYYTEIAWWRHAELTEVARLRVERESYKVALQFGDLILIVVYWPLAKWGIRVEKGKFAKLAPNTAVVKEYVHPSPGDTSTSESACLLYATTIGVVPHRGAEGPVRPGA